MRHALAILHRPSELVRIRNGVTKTEKVRGSRLAGILPLGFRREPVLVPWWQMPRLLFALAQFLAIRRSFEPGKFFHWTIGVLRKMARVFTHQTEVLPLSHLILA